MSWLHFVCAFGLLLILLFLPAALLRRFGFGLIGATALSPLISTSIICLLGIILDFFGVSTSGLALVLGYTIFCIISFLLLRFRGAAGLPESRTEITPLVFFVAVGLCFCGVFFILPLNGPDSFVQYSDNVAHLNRIQVMADDGVFSILNTGGYPFELPSGQVPISSGRGFYPAGISVLGAILSSTIHVSAALSQNAVLFSFMAVVLPLGFCYLIDILFDHDRIALVLGGFCVFLFAAFPFGLLLYGPLYPNVVSMCCAPAVAAVFIELLTPGLELKRRVVNGFVFLFASFALCTLQPNTVFLLAVFLTPYCCCIIYQRVSSSFAGKVSGKPFAAICAVFFALFAFGVWTACFLSPAFRSVVSFRWESLYSIPYAIWSLFSLALRRNLPQYVAAIVVLIGLICALFSKKTRWMFISYVLMGCIYVVGISTEGFTKHFLAGFWYTDPYRTAASVALLAVPLAVVGLRSLIALFARLCKQSDSKRSVVVAACLGLFVLVLNVVLPNYGYSKPAFAEVFDELTFLNDSGPDKLLTYDEMRFLDQVAPIVGDDLVLNNAFDGSVFAYPMHDINVYFKTMYLAGSKRDARLIAKHIGLYGIDPGVTEAVRRSGAKYVLLLDTGNYIPMSEDVLYSQYALYHFRGWSGFDSIPVDSPYFTVVLDDGYNRLLRIDA